MLAKISQEATKQTTETLHTLINYSYTKREIFYQKSQETMFDFSLLYYAKVTTIFTMFFIYFTTPLFYCWCLVVGK